MGLVRCPMSPAHSELVRGQAAARVAQDARRQHDIREGHAQGGDGEERSRREAPQHLVPERARADALGGVEDHGHDRGLDAREYPSHPHDIAERDVDIGQDDEADERGQDEQRPGHDATRGPM